MVIRNELDGALNFWNYTARLKAKGLRKVISVSDILPELGIGENLPLIGYVFSEKWAKENPKMLQGFLEASHEARQILYNNDSEWDRIKDITGAKNVETLIALRDVFRSGIPDRNKDYTESIKKAFKILASIGGKDLVGKSKELANGVIWSQ